MLESRIMLARKDLDSRGFRGPLEQALSQVKVSSSFPFSLAVLSLLAFSHALCCALLFQGNLCSYMDGTELQHQLLAGDLAAIPEDYLMLLEEVNLGQLTLSDQDLLKREGVTWRFLGAVFCPSFIVCSQLCVLFCCFLQALQCEAGGSGGGCVGSQRTHLRAAREGSTPLGKWRVRRGQQPPQVSGSVQASPQGLLSRGRPGADDPRYSSPPDHTAAFGNDPGRVQQPGGQARTLRPLQPFDAAPHEQEVDQISRFS